MKRSGSGGAVQDPLPWHVGLGFSLIPGKLDPICGGTILDRTTILTARHCMIDFWFPQAIFVLAGSSNLNAKVKLHAVSEIIRPNMPWNKMRRRNDIAILKLKEPLKMSKYVRAACLPDGKLNLADGKQCFIGGWGQEAYSDKPPLEQMTASSVSIANHQKCHESFMMTLIPQGITEDMVCAHGRGIPACSSDSGGALICMEGNHPVLSGWLTVYNKNCSEGNPAIYTRADSFLDWIKSNMVNWLLLKYFGQLNQKCIYFRTMTHRLINLKPPQLP